MYELYPYFTNDGSVGLFSPDADDIYHSTYGALSEAYEKFILPAQLDNFFAHANNAKVLDICFGIGYNTKSFLNYFSDEIATPQKNKKIIGKKNFIFKNFSKTLEKFFLRNFVRNDYIDTIHTDNIEHNGTIDTDNTMTKNNVRQDTCNNRQKYKIYIKAIDVDKNLAFLAPFFTQKDKIQNNHLDFTQERISKLLKHSCKCNFKIRNEINEILFTEIIKTHPQLLEDKEIRELLNCRKYRRYFDPYMRNLFKNLTFSKGKYTPYSALSARLHNIYYRYISKRHKRALNTLKNVGFSFDLNLQDARHVLLHDKNTYDFIFLDAFTPAKCPSLWSYEFFKLLYSHLAPGGMLLTYSAAATVRSAMLHAGFNIGKTFNPLTGKYIGTIATKSAALIEHPLTEYELGLLKTRAGIFYRDETLSLENEAIIAAHKSEVEKSSLPSSTQYIKRHKQGKTQ